MTEKLTTPSNRKHQRWIVLVTDLMLIVVSYGLATLLLSATERWVFFPPATPLDLSALLISGAIAFGLLGLHRSASETNVRQTLTNIAIAGAVMSVVGAVISAALSAHPTPFHVFLVAGMAFLILAVTARLTVHRSLLTPLPAHSLQRPVIIYGAGQTGKDFAQSLEKDAGELVVAFVDDDPDLRGQTINGLMVHPPAEIPELVRRFPIGRIVLAMPDIAPPDQSRIVRALSPLGCDIHALPAIAQLSGRAATTGSRGKPVDLNALLGRDRLEEDLPGVSETYHSRSILVTGAGGSIGSEICRQLMAFEPERIVLMDHSELLLFEIDRELRHMGTDVDIQPVLGSVCERDLVTGVMAKYKVDTVLHAAAYKHVPLVEYNALEGMRNNVLGTKVVADAARDAGVERFILVSTDKAVRPSSIMGASKRFAELLIQDLATRATTTRFAMVRFGNVLGSSGSVIPLFQEQIARGGPVTLTHNDVTRYFMTIPEAVQLVLLAGTFSRGGDVFVLDMGKPIPIRDVARKMIEGAGLSVRDTQNPKGDIEIKITGLRPGEKMHEELLIGSDMLTTPHKRILRAQEDHLSEIEMANALNALRQAIETRDPKLMNETLSKWIERADKAKPVIVNE